MADVPAVLLIGDSMVNGGAPGVQGATTSTATTEVETFGDQELMTVVPSDSSGIPNASTLGWYPWFDLGYGTPNYTTASSTSTSVTVTPNPGWATDEHKGKLVSTVNATTIGFGNRTWITANTSDTLTVSSWTSAPTAGIQVMIGDGAWRDYHPAAGWLAPIELGLVAANRSGSSPQSLGLGVGPDAGLIHRLMEIYPSAPRFQLAKYGAAGTTVTDWYTGGALRTTFEAWLATVNSAWTALASGNTLVWDLIVIDNSQRDVLDWGPAPGGGGNPSNALLYQARLQAWITYLRTTLGNASAKVILVNHDLDINAEDSPNGTGWANARHRDVAAADSLVRTISLEGQRLRGADPGYGLPTEKNKFYAASVYWDQYATKVADAYSMALAGTASASSGGFPVYLLLGDSIAVGQVNETFTGQLNSPTLTGTERPAAQGIWNPTTGAIEPYDLGDNSNTSGTVVATGGPEFSLMVELEKIHPDGFALVKRASNSSALVQELTAYVGTGSQGGVWVRSTSSEHWDALEADVQGALQYINTITAKQGDVRGAFVILGTNDAATIGGGAAFAQALPGFVSDLREVFGTRTSGAALPVIWRKPQLATATAQPDDIRTIRAALEAYALTDDQFSLVNVDDLERDATDNIHETPDSTILDGQRLSWALAAITL